MTYDTWKTTEAEHSVGFICDACALTFPERDMIWRGGTCFCPRCAEKAGWREDMPDDGG